MTYCFCALQSGLLFYLFCRHVIILYNVIADKNADRVVCIWKKKKSPFTAP